MKRKGKAVKMKIANKLVVLFLVASFIPLAIAGFIAYRQMSSTLQAMILYRLETLAKERADRLERSFAERNGDVAMLARVPAVADALEDFTRAFSSGGLNAPGYLVAESRYALLMTALTDKKKFYDFILVGPAGDVVFTLGKQRDLGTNLRTGRFNDTELARVFALASAENRVVISETRPYEPSRAPSAFLAAPVRKEDLFVGVVAIQMPATAINEIAGDYAGLGETGETSIVTSREGETIWVAPTRHDPGAAFTRKLELGTKATIPAQEAVYGKSGRGAYPDYRGVRVLAAWRHIPLLRLGLVIKIDESESLAPVRALTPLFVFLGLGALIGVFALSLVMGRSISGPLLALSGAVDRMAGGDLSARTDIRAGDEIGVLGAAFNKMSETLQHQTKSRERLSRELEIIIDSIPGLVFYKDTENRFIRVNKYMADAYKKTKKELEGVSLYDLHSREEAQASLDDDLKVIHSGKPKLNYDEGWPTETGFRWVNTSKIPDFDEKGEAIGIIGVSMDVTERKLAEEAVCVSEARLSNALQMARAGHWEYDVDKDIFTFNDNFYRIFRTTAAEIGGYQMSSADYARRFCHPEDAAVVGDESRAAIETSDPNYNRQIEHRILYADGEVGTITVRFFVIKDAHGRTVKTFGVNQDITDRKKIEENLRAALEERGVMLREIHHRVKNNMQIISSLLRLQSHHVKDKKVLDILNASQNRIKSIALVHQKLYQSGDFTQVDFSDYIADMVVHLFASLRIDAGRIRYRLEAMNIKLDIGRAISCGLIINELVVNALKHAFPEGREGEILVRMRPSDGAGFELAVKDNGVGLPKGFVLGQEGSLGLQIVSDLAKQIDASIEIKGDAGTEIIIRW